jgi:hypothetical protein
LGIKLRHGILTLALIVAGAACKGKHNRVTVQNEEDTAPPSARSADTATTARSAETAMTSLVHMSDTNAPAQLLSGFYGLENGSWRWTSGKFSVLLRTPPGAGQGGVVTFAFSIPEVAIQRLKSIAITASINGTNLKSSAYDKAGTNLFSAEVPPALLTGDSVKVDFSLDKTIPPDIDKRELGVVATSVGLSGR